jgi:FkbM family methyltransferase
MKLVNGWWLPDNEVHFAEQDLNHYQEKHRENSLKYVKNFRTAIDIGAHVGTWSKFLCKRFDSVWGFEPAPTHMECLVKNVTAYNFYSSAFALSDKQGTLYLDVEENNSGATHIGETGIQCATVTLDSLIEPYGLQDVDYIKLDVEGYEYFVLKGAQELISMYSPIIHLEQKKHAIRYGIEQYAALDLLKKWGYKQLCQTVADYTYGKK